MIKYFCLSLMLLLLASTVSALEMGTNTVKNGSVILYNLWARVISPVDGPRCFYRPSCATYARIAVSRYGIFKGGMMASERLQRCTSCHSISDYEQEGQYLKDPVENNVY